MIQHGLKTRYGYIFIIKLLFLPFRLCSLKGKCVLMSYLRLLISGSSSFHPAALGCHGFRAWVLIGYLSHPLFHLLQTLQDRHPELGIYRNEGGTHRAVNIG